MKKGEQKFGGPPPYFYFFKSELSEMARTLIEKSKGGGEFRVLAEARTPVGVRQYLDIILDLC
jgi:hypothetical protein